MLSFSGFNWAPEYCRAKSIHCTDNTPSMASACLIWSAHSRDKLAKWRSNRRQSENPLPLLCLVIIVSIAVLCGAVFAGVGYKVLHYLVFAVMRLVLISSLHFYSISVSAALYASIHYTFILHPCRYSPSLALPILLSSFPSHAPSVSLAGREVSHANNTLQNLTDFVARHCLLCSRRRLYVDRAGDLP